MSFSRTSSGMSTTPFRPPGPASRPSAPMKPTTTAPASSDDEFGTFLSDEDLQPLDITGPVSRTTAPPPQAPPVTTTTRPANTTSRPPAPSSPPVVLSPSPPPALPARDSEDIPGIPAALLTRIAHSHFQHADTGLSAAGQAALGRYVDIFVREAVARAAEGQRTREGQDDVWLDAADLEAIAPGLLMDY